MKNIVLGSPATLEELTKEYIDQLDLEDSFNLNFDALDEVLAEAVKDENEELAITHAPLNLLSTDFEFYIQLLIDVQNSREKNNENFIKLLFHSKDREKFTKEQIDNLKCVSFV